MKVTRSALSVLLWFQYSHQISAFSAKNYRRLRGTLVKRSSVPGADIEQSPTDERAEISSNVRIPNRGKVNEIDFCIAPADVSLSRSYAMSSATIGESKNQNTSNGISSTRESTLSLTRFLNNAANRAVRRILLARSWPSAEALNMSLRLVALAEKEKESQMRAGTDLVDEEGAEKRGSASTAKCPVPRPILKAITRRQKDLLRRQKNTLNSESQKEPRRSRTDAEYVADQLKSFQEKYGKIPGYLYAEAYLESILALATSGEESPRVSEVMESGIYDESYKRVTAVLKSVGTVFVLIPGTDRYKIAQKLVDQDICLALFDKFNMDQTSAVIAEQKKDDIKLEVAQEQQDNSKLDVEQNSEEKISEEAKETSAADSSGSNRKLKFRVKFWKKDKTKTEPSESKSDKVEEDDEDDVEEEEEEEKEEQDDVQKLDGDDLGGVLLSSKEPSMTRNLNSLSNIVQRTLLFGGDQELLVLYETLIADLSPFIERWYPGTGGVREEDEEETRPGVQYYNCLLLLLRDCYINGFTSDLNPPLPSLAQSYKNSYERLMATLVELGSGYIKPIPSNVMAMPKPRTPQEELGRFAVWETTFRAQVPEIASYPEDLEGVWEVRDEIGGKTIGVSTVVLKSKGEVQLAPPMQGLRWRLDPGPTHLDTCTFQVLGDDGTILQYRGFIDRGARIESRFSGRSIAIRGSVMFQMRDSDVAIMGEDYWKDMLPINYKTGTTKFVMTKKVKDKQ